MPKVTEEYLSEKKKYIIECTEQVVMKKPLYLITMRDIIKAAGLSQGGIYRYYTSIDEIYVDFLNKHTAKPLLEKKIDALLNSEQSERNILAECLITMGDYIQELMKSVVGKVFLN